MNWAASCAAPMSAVRARQGAEPRRERPRLGRASAAPRAVKGSFTSRFRVPVSSEKWAAFAGEHGPSRGPSACACRGHDRALERASDRVSDRTSARPRCGVARGHRTMPLSVNESPGPRANERDRSACALRPSVPARLCRTGCARRDRAARDGNGHRCWHASIRQSSASSRNGC